MEQLTTEYIQNVYNTCKDKREFIDLLNIQSERKSGTVLNIEILNHLRMINPNITKLDITAKAFRDRYKQRLIDEYNKNPNICVICRSIVPYDRKDTYTCCKKCCHIKANKERGPRSNETKQKISLSIKQTAKLKYELTPKYHNCVICGKTFERPRLKNGRLSRTKVCSNECYLQLKILNGKQTYEKLKSEGRFKGWQSRNITSYPEKFWKQVLKNNDITYKFNYKFDKYFLDFYIEIGNRKIDLEIDGKQHKYQERLESDKIRDEFVKSQNIEVYRIDWNEINSDYGKVLMKEKIDKFLEYVQER